MGEPVALPDRERPDGPPWWPWGLLVLALIWVVVVRIPLILNVHSHLDSDLAVDGLTLLDATQGHWRWHYPATPDMGIFPMFLSLPQAIVWGANPTTLVSGGTVAYAGLVVAVFTLAWRAFGPTAAAWSLVPLAFASTGAIWLSARITGGHLLTAVWHAVAFVLVYQCLSRGGWPRMVALGLWCGLGIALDVLFLLTLVGLVPAGVVAWWESGASRRGWLGALVFVPAFLVGVLPREIGLRTDPHNAYGGQLAFVKDPRVLREHTAILVSQCLPRLIAGHQCLPRLFAGRALSEYPSDPDPETLPIPHYAPRETSTILAASVTWLGFALFLLGVSALAAHSFGGPDPARRAVCRGLLISALSVLAAFVVNQNIFNSDNYRYLVTMLVPWALGFAVLIDRWFRRGRVSAALAVLLVAAFATTFTLDTVRWYQRLGWGDEHGWPIDAHAADPAVDWLDDHREVTHLYGDYWDVYRIAFLTEGRVKGVAYPQEPSRFPELARELPGGRPETMIVRGRPLDRYYQSIALREGGRVVHRGRGFVIIAWPLAKPAAEPQNLMPAGSR